MDNPDPSQASPHPSTPGLTVRVLLAVAVAGIATRLLLAALSHGSNDVRLFMTFAQRLDERGMRALLAEEPDFNHPPAPAAYALAVLRLSELTGLRFSLLFKLPLIAADAATMLLLWRLWRRRRMDNHTTTAAAAAALFAWSLDSILVTGYHCNTDPLYGFLALLAAYLAETRGRHFAAGLALAAAVNVKLIPILLLPAFLAPCRDRRQALRLLAGASIGAVPYAVMLLVYGRAFYEQVIGYNPRLAEWGVGFLLRRCADVPPIAEAADILIRRYRAWGKYLMLLVIALAAIDARRLRWDHYRAAAVAGSLFLILTPGFGVQYTVFPVPLLFAVSAWFAAAYSLAAGAYLLTLYVYFWTGTFPWASTFPGPEPLGPALIGLLAWSVLVAFVVRQWTATPVPRDVPGSAPAAAPSASPP